MNNSLIKKHLIVEESIPFFAKNSMQTQSKSKNVSRLLSINPHIHSSLDKTSIDISKLQPKSALRNNTLYSFKKQQNPAFMTKQFQPTHHLVRAEINSKEILKPKQEPLYLKRIQQKINSFVKNTPSPDYKNKNRSQNTKVQSTTYLQKFKLQLIFKNSKNPQEQAQKQEKSNKNNDYNNWYMKAIETHLKENEQTIDLKYSTQQNPLRKKTLDNQRRIGNSFYPKLSTGFKKRSVSYQVKYI